jgi:hypothetical protein
MDIPRRQFLLTSGSLVSGALFSAQQRRAASTPWYEKVNFGRVASAAGPHLRRGMVGNGLTQWLYRPQIVQWQRMGRRGGAGDLIVSTA